MLTWLLPVALALDANKVKYAVNCGGPLLTTFDGITYVADTGYSSGIASDYGKDYPIKLTTSSEVYQTERYAENDFTYTIPLKESGTYVLILKFAEVWFSSEQEKMFNVRIGDTNVVEMLDVFAQVGKYAAYDEFIEFSFKEGKILIDGKETKGGYKDGKLIVTFVKTNFDNPKINAIVLLKGKLEDTNYKEQQNFLQALRKQAEEEEERKRRSYRVDKVYEDDGDFEEIFEQRDLVIEENQSIFSVLSSVPALVVIGLVLVFGVAACIPIGPSKKPVVQELEKKGKGAAPIPSGPSKKTVAQEQEKKGKAKKNS